MTQSVIQTYVDSNNTTSSCDKGRYLSEHKTIRSSCTMFIPSLCSLSVYICVPVLAETKDVRMTDTLSSISRQQQVGHRQVAGHVKGEATSRN
jgi:hypothetical protein